MIHTAEEFIRLGHKVTVYTSNASSLTKFNQGLKPVEEIKGMTIKRFPIIASLKGFWITPSMYNQMMKDDFDVMHSWCLRCFQSEVAALVSFRTGKPLFINSGGSMGSYQSPTTTKSQKILHYLHNPMDMLVMKIAKKLIAVNKFERERCEKKLNRIKKELNSMKNKLRNKDFISKAPKDVVENIRSQSENIAQDKIKIEEQIKMLH